MKAFFFDIRAGNLIGREKPRTVFGMVYISVNSDGSSVDEEELIRQTLEECAKEIEQRLERNFPTDPRR